MVKVIPLLYLVVGPLHLAKMY